MRSRRAALLLTFLALWHVGLIAPPLADAVTIQVDTVDDERTDDGDCSLREALHAANGNVVTDACPAGSDAATDEIVLPAGTYTLGGQPNEDLGEAGDLDVLGNGAALDLIVTGAGRAATVIQACTVSQKLAPCPAGQGTNDRVFNVRGAAVTFRHLTMRHGSAATGGAVYGVSPSNPGPITFDDCVLTDNHVSGDGGAIRSFYDVVVVDSTISDNSAQSRGGGVFNEGTTLDVRGSTFSGNFALGAGGAIINSSGASATIANSTISGNSTGVNGGGIFSFDALTITNCTITGNVASMVQNGSGGGIAIGTTATVYDSIIAGNVDLRPTSKTPDCLGTLSAQGFNIIGDGTFCSGIANGVNGSQVGTPAAPIDAKLGPLADNGGPTPTHAPLADSPAVGGGSPALPGGPAPACAATDQRGIARPQGAVCDCGAVETTATPTVLALASIAPKTGGNAGTVSPVLHGDAFAPGATVRLTRAGSGDIVGVAPSVAGTGALLTTFDLAGATPGVWNVVVTNPDTTTATLADGFTVEAGGAPVLWADVLARRKFRRGRLSTVYVVYGNRGNVDATGVPLWVSFPDDFPFALRFAVTPPPTHPQQPSTDWGLVAPTMRDPSGAARTALPLLVPFVPAGFSGVLELRLRPPPTHAIGPFEILFDVGPPYFQPTLTTAARDRFVLQAKAHATGVLGAVVVPTDDVIADYVTTQLEVIRTAGPAAWRADFGRSPAVYSLAQLLIDAGQFTAATGGTPIVTASGRSAPADRPFAWMARALLPSAEARQLDPDCRPDPFFGECPEPDCEDQPPIGICEPDDYSPCDESEIFAPCDPQPFVPDLLDSGDPNDKVGPTGDQGYLLGDTPLPYSIFFENVATATAPAQEVVITDQLSLATLDLATFALGPIGFGDTLAVPPPGLKTFTADVDLRPAADLIVRIAAGLDAGTGIVTWRFTSLDPATGELTDDPLAGFLPPNLTPPAGDGSVLFTVAPKAALPLGTTICNDARIVFDLNAPIDTPEWCNTIGTAPHPEDCENCLDDDGDGTIDRADDDCTPSADGAGAGVAPAAVKPLATCAKALRKVGAKLTSDRIARVDGCLKAAADCVQLQAGSAACAATATAKCAKLLQAATDNAASLIASLGDKCAAAATVIGPASGLGFDADAADCAALGVTPLDTLPQILECVRRRHACAADRMIGAAAPRASELLSFAGRNPAVELPCLATTTGHGAVATDRRKAIRKCDVALQKAATKLLNGRTAARQSCAAAALVCVQEKPGDASCLTKARKACTKVVAKTASLEAAFGKAVSKGCGAAPLVMADLLAPEGLAVATLGATCAGFDVPALPTPAALATCLTRQIACRADQLAASATPRFRELLGLGGIAP